MESIEVYKPAGTVEEDFVNLVKLELNDIRNTFFKIGFRLREANQNRYYKNLGFESIEECAEALFGFKKTTTYDLMAIAGRFYDRQAPMTLAEPYRKFNQSQLVILSQKMMASEGFIARTRPEDSVEKIKKAKKYWNWHYNGKIRISNFYSLKTLDEIIEAAERVLSSQSSMVVKPVLEPPQNSGYPENKEADENSVYSENESNKESVIEIPKDDYEDKTEDQDKLKVVRCCFNCVHFCRFKNRISLKHQINGRVEIEGVCSKRCNEYNISFNPVYVPMGACGSFEEDPVPVLYTDSGVDQEYTPNKKQLDPVEFLKIQEDLKKFLSDKIDFMEYKIAWGEDKTKPGIRVVSPAFVDFISSQFFAYLDKNRTEVKNMLQAAVSNKVRSFDYQITLCGRKQPVNAFCGNVSNWILDTILEDYLKKQKEYAESKKKGRKNV